MIYVNVRWHILILKGGDLFLFQLFYFIRRGVKEIKPKRLRNKIKFWCQKGQSTLEYALVIVIAGIISAILIAIGKPLIIDIISKVFNKIASMV